MVSVHGFFLLITYYVYLFNITLFMDLFVSISWLVWITKLLPKFGVKFTFLIFNTNIFTENIRMTIHIFLMMSLFLFLSRCKKLKHQSWLTRHPPSLPTSPITSMFCSPATSSSNTSSSSVTGHIEHSSALNPRLQQCSDELHRRRLHSQSADFIPSQTANRTVPVCKKRTKWQLQCCVC